MKFEGSGWIYQVVCACGNKKMEVRQMYGRTFYRCVVCGIEQAESVLNYESR